MHTSTPEIRPIIIAVMLLKNAQPAVTATRPARPPLAIIVGSGFLYFNQVYIIADNEPKAPASMVFVTITPILKSLPESVLPALNANQPKKSIIVPIIAMGI